MYFMKTTQDFSIMSIDSALKVVFPILCCEIIKSPSQNDPTTVGKLPDNRQLCKGLAFAVSYDFLVTVKAVPHECVIRTGQP